MKDAKIKLSGKKFKKITAILLGMRFKDVKDLKTVLLVRAAKKNRV